MTTHATTSATGPLVAFHFLGQVDFDACASLQARLVYDAGEREDGRIVVLLCEHPPLITIGRGGSRAHVRMSPLQLRQAQLETRWVSRGGGCVLHQPGQLAVYPIVPLARRGWSVGEYLRRLKQSIIRSLAQLRIRAALPESGAGVAGRSGLLASVGVAVRNDVTLHGAWVNVGTPLYYSGRIDAFSPQKCGSGAAQAMSSLLSERHEPVTMAEVRAALVAGLAEAFDCPRQVVTSGHPLLAKATSVA